MKVCVDITRPMVRGRFLKIGDKQLWLPVKYRRLPSFCFHHGMIKHKNGVFSMATRGKSGKINNEYGPWLHANPPMANSTSTKRYEGGGLNSKPPYQQQNQPGAEGAHGKNNRVLDFRFFQLSRPNSQFPRSNLS